MKRFLLFSGDIYYPGGGWNDFQGDFDTLNEATDKAIELKRDWDQIVDTETKEVIEL